MKANKIIKESLRVLILGSLLSSIGGFSLELIKQKLTIALPLIIILPSFASMVGSAGIISVSKITTLFYEKKISLNNLFSKRILHLFSILLTIFSFSAVYVVFLSLLIAYLKGFNMNLNFISKMLVIVISTTIIIISIVFLISIFGSRYAIKRNIDPDDFLIPITTSIADLGSLIVFSLLVLFFL